MIDREYKPSEFESKIYNKWLERAVFKPAPHLKETYTIIMPPPNVTGILHMGHALNLSLQDILVRYERAKGKSTLWLVGTDHAGIATQAVLERELLKESKRREDFTREEFNKLLWNLKEKHHSLIVNQIKSLGASCDWSRERFTLDSKINEAVLKAFVSLYEKGLIYQGMYLINWDPLSQTAVSDEEVEYRESEGNLYYIKYFLKDDKSKFIEIATTRPETIFGDVAIAVNPKDKRYKDLIGKSLLIPLINREIKVIQDSYVDMDFGSGALKITPAHDFNDFEIGKRHNLEKIVILDKSAKLNENTPHSYQFLSVKEAREKIKLDLEKNGHLIAIEPIKHSVGYCQRSGAVIEPMLSKQWFVKMKPLALKGLEALERGEIKFFPKRWENTYKYWLENIKDWCISRQLWWGHRIPAYKDLETGELIVSAEDPNKSEKYKSRKFIQDEDVLDTWFSSWLWPFSSLGWPSHSQDFKNFYPTQVLISGYDIIFFWVARMVMAGKEFTGVVPFKDIYLTPLIRDKKGRKMSKSLGNGIDPLEIVKNYGSDALRFTLSFLAVQGQDINLDEKTFSFGAKFANKVWNASKFILSNVNGRNIVKNYKFNSIDKYLLHSFNKTLKLIENAMSEYKFNDASRALYEYFWNDFCDWYLEVSKVYLKGTAQEQDETISKLLFFLKEALTILHPFMPFISEEIYSLLVGSDEVLALRECPIYKSENIFEEDFKNFRELKEFITKIRTLKSEFNTGSKSFSIAVNFKDKTLKTYFKEHENLILSLLNAKNIFYNSSFENMIGSVSSKFEAFADIKSLIDLPRERERLKKSLERYLKLEQSTQLKLSLPSFKEKAPMHIVEGELEKLEEFREIIKTLNNYLLKLK